MKKDNIHNKILIVLLILILTIIGVYWQAGDKEFIYYGFLTIFISIPFIYFLSKKFNISTRLVVGMSVLVLVNMLAGGIVLIKGIRLYEWIPIKLFYYSPEFTAIKFDQVVHAYGGFICTAVMYVLLKNQIKIKKPMSIFIFFMILLAGFGAASFYEIVEFVAKFFEENGVGEYYNTVLDLCANFIGAIIFSSYTYVKSFRGKQ